MRSCDKFWFPHHNWGKWEVVGTGKLLNYNDPDSKMEVGHFERLRRVCADCGDVQQEYRRFWW